MSVRTLVHRLSEWVVLLQFAVIIFGGGAFYQKLADTQRKVEEQSAAVLELRLTLAKLSGKDELHDEQIRALQRDMERK